MCSILNYCKYLNEIKYDANTTLLKEGESDNTLYVLKEGSVEIRKNGVKISEVSNPGALFGEMSVLLDVPHTAQVVTLSESTIYTIQNASEFLKNHKDFSYHLSKILAERLQLVNENLTVLKTQLKDKVDEVDTVIEKIL